VSIAKTDLAIMTNAIEHLMTATMIKTIRDQRLELSAGVVVGAEGIEALDDVDVTAQSPSRMMVTMTIPDARSIEADVITWTTKSPLVPRTRTRTKDILIETAPRHRQSPNDPATAAAVIETRISERIEKGTKTTIVVMIARNPAIAPRIGTGTMIASVVGIRTEIVATKTVKTVKIDIGIGTDAIATGKRTGAVKVIESATRNTAANTSRPMPELLPTKKT